MRDGRMHQTTIRFSPDLWGALEEECGRLGVSAAQYLREAAVARLSYTAGRRRDPELEQAFAYADALSEAPGAAPAVQAATAESAAQVLAAAAVTAQSEQVRRQSRQIREHAAELRRVLREKTR